MFLAQGGRLKGGSAHAGKRLALGVLLGGHERIHSVEGAVEGLGGLGSGGDGREVGARYRVVSSRVGDRFHAALLHGLGELGGDELIGNRRARRARAHELAAHEKRHSQKNDDHDHGGAGRR